MLELLALLPQCAPTVAPETMAAIVSVESGKNPYAIGVVGGHLARQPRNLPEAVATARHLESLGWNFSVGVAQVNRYNLTKYGLTYEKAFDACASLSAAAKILTDCYVRAKLRTPDSAAALQAALSCYYSGNFSRGFIPDVRGQQSYVQKVWAAAGAQVAPIRVVPAIRNAIRAEPRRTLPARSDATASAADDGSVVLLKADRKTKDAPGGTTAEADATALTGNKEAREPALATPADQRNSVVVF
jgi:type IV secretion system protein VirB1